MVRTCGTKNCYIPSCGNYRKYCPRHNCIYRKCNGETGLRYLYCDKHLCQYGSCDKLKDSKEYCIEHRCRKSRCVEHKKSELDGYCTYHHKCDYKDCSKHAENTFCNRHKCSDCNSKAESDKSLCTKCILKMSNESKA
jgi:hypothetical protein